MYKLFFDNAEFKSKIDELVKSIDPELKIDGFKKYAMQEDGAK